jgi:acetyl-CoA carboxylase biotin carboxyl carrier protein
VVNEGIGSGRTRGGKSPVSRDVDLRRPPVTLTAKDVAEITRLLEESNFDELYLELEGLKLSVRRGSAATVQPLDSAATVQPLGNGGSASAAQSAALGAPAADDTNSASVSAPLLGTFYRAPKPGATPFVEVGSPVEEDTIIGIIEVMKLMNTVRAGVRGKVIQILCEDGALVEYGETLMRVGRTS